ncbi:MAG: hypothetical protein CL763_01035 [Chloroflexi bacterium]|nr:hypothetical protein [Chloroflexota bacterium]|tara:strand:+ start:5691 stop:5888 length:198 start_codon:yes stop_codon:yes gene_type:complete
MTLNESTVRQLIEDLYGDQLTSDEIEKLVPMVKRQYEISDRLEALDLGGLDPRATQYITDRRLVP